jgi:hypothetical protein
MNIYTGNNTTAYTHIASSVTKLVATFVFNYNTFNRTT